jgi:hypothetical protein
MEDNELNGCNLLGIVGEINYDIWLKLNPDTENPTINEGEYPQVELRTNGESHLIYFMDVIIWSSDNEEREWIDDDMEYEPLKLFLEKEIQKLLYKISALKS